ncbi:uncharacterized protein si:ch211-256a21.4 isoform X2 [Brienomyrus brachyistius]|uniref:uncharacterized protein si:ch211-256a21.4 isoform X2 n=1 Tax=Brienomyrus brachyistius TaxID=42636 RepID=UPI0020B42907|nr:uncharacterized protein si:ch211-256a21.4 isoform X2 [Brienomyrus brachyistius]
MKTSVRMLSSELRNPASRFRLAQSAIGLAGCGCVMYAVWMPRWFGDRGLWEKVNDTKRDTDDVGVTPTGEVEYVFAILSFLMGLSSGVLCLTFAFCWTSQTVRSYSNTRSLLMVGQMLYPTTLLLITLACTGFFFLLCWSFFTYQKWGDISANPSQLGSSYWLGAMGLILLLVVLPVVFVAEQCIVPDPLAELKNSAETWWITVPTSYSEHSLNDSSNQEGEDFLRGQTRYMPFP